MIHTIPHLLLGDHDHDEHHGSSDMSSKEAHGSCGHDHSNDHEHHDHEVHAHSDHSDHGHGHGDNHENMIYVGVLVLIGFLVFFIAEKLASSRGHSHSHAHVDESKEVSSPVVTKEIMVDATSPEKSDKSNKNLRKRTINTVPSDVQSKIANTETEGDYKNGKDKNDKTRATAGVAAGTTVAESSTGFLPSFSKLSAAGWLNLLADSMHNFTDGIAIGALLFGIIRHKITWYIGVKR